MTVGNSSSKTWHSICGSRWIALLLTADGLLSTLLECSAHLSKIASLSVRSVLPSVLSSGVAPELWAINYFQCIMELLHVLSVCKRLDFFCFLAEPGVLFVPEPALDRLSNIAVGSYCIQSKCHLGVHSASGVFFKKPLIFFIFLVKPVLVFARWMS